MLPSTDFKILRNRVDTLSGAVATISGGSQGPAGTAATVTVGTTTTGTTPNVANAGTTSAAILNFTLPGGTASPLVFTTFGSDRKLTGYTEGSTTQTVRAATISGGVFTLTLATFTPSFPVNGNAATPSNSPNWDVAVTGFTVSVTNPTDVTSQWIKAVSSISGATGALSGFNAGTQSPSAAISSVSWTQPFTVSASKIQSNGSGTSGGSATITVYFQDNNSSTDSVNWAAVFTVSWAAVSNSLSVNGLSGNTFLQTYASTGYNVGTSGLTTSSNAAHTVTASGGTASSSTGSGTLTFTSPIHKSTGTIPSVSLSTTFTRPAGVTGAAYTTSAVTKGPTTPSVSFSYPSFWLFTDLTVTPGNSDIVNGTVFKTGVTQLSDAQVKFDKVKVTNSASVSKKFWFGVKSSLTQPTIFQTGPSSSLLSDTDKITVYLTGGSGGTGLQPTGTVPSGYQPEAYTLYGMTVGVGDTYIYIS
jgi:hypothetical protein